MQRRSLLKQLGALGAASAVSFDSATAVASLLQAITSTGAPAKDQPSAIFCNQLGYLPASSKVATVRAAPLPDLTFRLRSVQTGRTVFESTLTSPAVDAASGDRVSQADFSALTAPGVYRLETSADQGEPFSIQSDAYAHALRLSMRAFYGQRCGCKVDLGQGYEHPACHSHAAFHPSSGRSGSISNSGGWHDAGDYGRYVVNSGITTGTLLWAWELYPRALGSLQLDIPESGRKLPDVLAEIQWNLQWMLSLQDTDGGVWHKQTSERFCPFVMPERDDLTSFVIGSGTSPFKTSAATADLAAVAAIAARCYAPFDPGFARTCLQAARRAWSWAVAHPDLPFRNPGGITTGEYGDTNPGDEILWASAELWRTTGDPDYEKHFLAALTPTLPRLRITSPGWNNLSSLACWTYVLSGRPGSSAVMDRIRAATAEAAGELIAASGASGYGNTLSARDFVWGSNAVAANQSMLLLMAQHIGAIGGPSASNAAFGNLHYLLGRNCHGVSWVTHLGSRPFLRPHHRPSAADTISNPWPGLLSGGPNARPADEVARTLPSAPPMRMWVDDQRAYSLNEVAINWNAPLVFLLAAASSSST